jgi:hypothetical protein
MKCGQPTKDAYVPSEGRPGLTVSIAAIIARIAGRLYAASMDTSFIKLGG